MRAGGLGLLLAVGLMGAAPPAPRAPPPGPFALPVIDAARPAGPPVRSGQGLDVIETPAWTRRPGGQDASRYYPELAARLEIEGRAMVVCRAAADGMLSDCGVDGETPPGFGFGRAGVMLAGRMQLSATQADGKPIAGRWVRVPMTFALGDGGPTVPAFGFSALPPVGPVALIWARPGEGATLIASEGRKDGYMSAIVTFVRLPPGGKPAQLSEELVDCDHQTLWNRRRVLQDSALGWVEGMADDAPRAAAAGSWEAAALTLVCAGRPAQEQAAAGRIRIYPSYADGAQAAKAVAAFPGP